MASPQQQLNKVPEGGLTKEQWIAEIGELWNLLLDLKVYPDWKAVEADLFKTCRVRKRSDLTLARASAYITILREKLRMAEAKIPVANPVELKIAPAPIKAASLKPGQSTQKQFSAIKKLEKKLIELGVFDDMGASRMWLHDFTKARCYVELTEEQAGRVITEMTRIQSAEAVKSRPAAIPGDTRLS